MNLKQRLFTLLFSFGLTLLVLAATGGKGNATTITVLPIDDTDFGLPRSVIITLVGGAEYVVGTPNTAVVTIADNDTLVSIVATDPGAAENGPDTGTLTVTRLGPTAGALTVFYAVSGAAINGTDYTTLPGSVTTGAGSTSATVTVTPIDDPLFEGPENVTLTLSANAAYTVGALGGATVTIADND